MGEILLRSVLSRLLITFLFLSVLHSGLNILTVSADPVTIYVDDDNIAGPWDGTSDHPYQNITSGLENAMATDTIFVYNGTYAENIVVSVTQTLAGESNIETTIDGGGAAPTVEITANNVSFSGFNVKNGDYGTYGVRLDGVDGCRIFGNRFTQIFVAVVAEYSNNNTINDNHMENLSRAAIGIFHSHNNTVSGNTITRVSSPTVWQDGAISILADSTGNIVASNNITDVSDIAAIMIQEVDAYSNLVSQNYIEDCERGIDLFFGTYENIVVDNVVSNCKIKSPGEYGGYGIVVGEWGSCERNVIIRNNVTNCEKIGIRISVDSSDNVIYHNYVVGNDQNAYDYADANDWDNGYPYGGNFWGDYAGLDQYRGPYQNETGSDGIGDTAYFTSGNGVDHYPLMKPIDHDIAITSVTTSEGVVVQGYPVSINVTVENQEFPTETFNVTVCYDEILIEEREVTLTSRNSTTLTFTWNTTGVEKGDYSISAEASVVTGETDVADNNKTDGTVTVLSSGHDIAIKDITPSKTVVGLDYSLSILITVKNYGNHTETFNVTTHYDSIPIETKNVTNLPSGAETTVTFTWNTTGLAKGNYTIIANVTIVLGETDTDDNTHIDGIVLVTIPGDVNGDRTVDIFDAILLANAFGSEPGDGNWDPSSDLNGDLVVDIFDAIILAGYFGESW